MEHTTFFGHYRICTNKDGTAREVSRIGPVINYKAIDTRSDHAVLLQLLPVASVDQTKREQFEECARITQKLDHINIAKVFAAGVEHDHYALISEYFEGESTESWIAAHGAMPVDAVLRVGLQAVRAIAAATFFGLTHRAIQPSNLLIVPGQSPDGGWPFVKVLNFGLASLDLCSESAEAGGPTSVLSSQFGSPEQPLNRGIDFRSEIYSLGATMFFLLTGTVPLAAGEMKARLPELRRAPRALRNLLVHMLRENPDHRPQDPVACESEMCECLAKIERRQSIGRRLGIPLAAVIPRKSKGPKEPRAPLAQIMRGLVAFAVIILATAAVGAFFFQDRIPFLHRTGKIGIQIGVPDAGSFGSVPAQSGNVALIGPHQPTTNSSPAIATREQNTSPRVQESETSNVQPGAVTAPGRGSSSTQITSAPPSAMEPAPPAEQPSVAEKSGQPSSTQLGQSRKHTEKKGVASTSNRKSTSRTARLARARRYEDELGRVQAPPVRQRSRVIGTTADGRMILRLPSGRIVIVTPRYEDEDVLAPPPHRRVFTEQPDYFAPRPPPFYSPGYPFND
jgi:serine/threonine protein kinase